MSHGKELQLSQGQWEGHSEMLGAPVLQLGMWVRGLAFGLPAG